MQGLQLPLEVQRVRNNRQFDSCRKRILTLSPDTSEFDYPVMQLHGCENMKFLNKVFVSCDMSMQTEGKYSHHLL